MRQKLMKCYWQQCTVKIRFVNTTATMHATVCVCVYYLTRRIQALQKHWSNVCCVVTYIISAWEEGHKGRRSRCVPAASRARTKSAATCVLCCVVLCSVMIYYVVLCYVMLCYVTQYTIELELLEARGVGYVYARIRRSLLISSRQISDLNKV